MIYTVTLNPSLDYLAETPEFCLGRVNRTTAETLRAGGKGINVSRMLKSLGVDSVALGLLAGFTGEEIARQVREEGIAADFIRLEQGVSRLNVKLRAAGGTEINGRGPAVGEKPLALLRERLACLRQGDILCLSGSLPQGVPHTIYRDLAAGAAARGAAAVVDAAGETLLAALSAKPLLIKPNQQELSALFDVPVRTPEEAVSYARRLQARGARNVLASFGGAGAVFVSEDGGTEMLPAPSGRTIDPVGAGDSMVAGFLAGLLAGEDWRGVFHLAVAAGSASAFSEGFAAREQVEVLRRELENRDGAGKP